MAINIAREIGNSKLVIAIKPREIPSSLSGDFAKPSPLWGEGRVRGK